MVVLPTLQWYCSEVYVSPVDKCLNVTASYFLKLVLTSRDGGGGGAFFNQIKNAGSILVKFLSCRKGSGTYSWLVCLSIWLVCL